MPLSELPWRSGGPEPAMMTAIGTAPRASRGTVRVPARPRPPFQIVYGLSVAAAGGTVSARVMAWPRACGAKTTSANATRSGLLMLLPPPQDVGLYDRHRDGQDRGRGEQDPHQRARHERRWEHHHPGDHEREPAGTIRLPPHRIARERPRRADADEPRRLHARERVAEHDEQQPHAHRH